MDGNRRWARARGKSVIKGHQAGAEALRKTVLEVLDLKIPFLTVFSFSTENWKRSEEEVTGLMRLMVRGIRENLEEFCKLGVQIRTLGDLSAFPDSVRNAIEEAVRTSAHNTKLVLSLALNFGGRDDLVRATRQIAEQVQKGQLEISDISESLFSEHLSLTGIPDPDLLIRTSGEQRVSNFLLWQLAYTEFVFLEQFWPDFDEISLRSVLELFAQRKRRFGS